MLGWSLRPRTPRFNRCYCWYDVFLKQILKFNLRWWSRRWLFCRMFCCWTSCTNLWINLWLRRNRSFCWYLKQVKSTKKYLNINNIKAPILTQSTFANYSRSVLLLMVVLLTSLPPMYVHLLVLKELLSLLEWDIKVKNSKKII